MGTKEEETMWHSFLQRAILPLCGVLLGFGTSQFLVVERMRETLVLVKQQSADNSERITRVSGVLEKQVELDTQILAMIRVQTQLQQNH